MICIQERKKRKRKEKTKIKTKITKQNKTKKKKRTTSSFSSNLRISFSLRKVVLRRFEAEAIFSFRTTTKKQMYISIGQLEQQNKLD